MNHDEQEMSDADIALMAAWDLGMGAEGWSDAVIDGAERVLPILIEAGYATTNGATWAFSPAGVERACELERITHP